MCPEPTHRTEEPDIGSGEKSPGHRETEKMISQVNDQSAHKKSEHDGLAQPTGPAQPGDDKH